MPEPDGMHRLTAASGLSVRLCELGAAIDRVEVPGPDGPTNVVLTFDDPAHRRDHDRNPHLGATVGRYANRLAGAAITIDGVTHELDANEGPNQLHGGARGFSRVTWAAEPGAGSVTFRRTSPDGEMGFPGTLEVAVTYTLADDRIVIDHVATTDAPTVVSLTNHAYWNLGGPTEPDVGDHVVTVDAATVVPVDEASLPSGPPEPVDGTPFDLRRGARLSDRIGFALPNGYDHCFMIEGGDDAGSGLRRHARIDHPPSGRSLEVWSDHPATQLYTGAFLPGTPGGDGRDHDPFAALCVEPQHVPDAPHLDWAPSPVLRPGETYRHRIELRLGFVGA